MNFPGRATLPALSTTDAVWPGKGPLGALPAISTAARRALALAGALALANAATLVAQAFLLASACATIVERQGLPATQLAALLGVVLSRSLIAWAMRAGPRKSCVPRPSTRRCGWAQNGSPHADPAS